MKKRKFDILFESIVQQINSIDDEETPEYKSFEEFKHFIKDFNIIAELDTESKNDKVIECSLYFIDQFDGSNKPVKFDYYNQCDQNYYLKYKNIFDKLQEYHKKYIVTLTR